LLIFKFLEKSTQSLFLGSIIERSTLGAAKSEVVRKKRTKST